MQETLDKSLDCPDHDSDALLHQLSKGRTFPIGYCLIVQIEFSIKQVYNVLLGIMKSSFFF